MVILSTISFLAGFKDQRVPIKNVSSGRWGEKGSKVRGSIFIKQLIWCRLATTEQLVSNEGGKFLKKLWCCVDGRI